MKLEHIMFAAGRHIRIGGMNQTFCDARMAEMDWDLEKGCIVVTPINDGKPSSKTIWVPLESIAFAVPAQAEPVEGVIARRRKARDMEQPPRGDAE